MLIVALLAGCSDPPVAPPPPDIMVIVMDTVRRDAVGPTAARQPATPRLDALADRGVRFTDVTSPGAWTWPAHASLFTGEPPWVHGARHHPGSGPDDIVLPMRTDLRTFAEALTDAGYRTTALSSNGWLHQDMGLTRGFERVSVFGKDSETMAAAQQELVAASSDDRPHLLLVNLMIAHAPWAPSPAPYAQRHAEMLAQAPPAWATPYLDGDPLRLDMYRAAPGQQLSGFEAYAAGTLPLTPDDLSLIADLYAGDVAAVDHLVGQLGEDWLARHPDGVLVVLSDHGEYLGEHQQLEHGLTAWPEVLEVPLVVVAPDRLPAGRQVTAPVRLHDVTGTIVQLAGLPPWTPSLLPIVAGQAPTAPVAGAAWRHAIPAQRVGGVFTRDWFYLRSGDQVLVQDSDGARQAFRRDSATGGLAPLAEASLSPEFLQAAPALLAQMQDPRTADGPGMGMPPSGVVSGPAAVPIPDDVRRGLEALGYIDGPQDASDPVPGVAPGQPPVAPAPPP